MGKLADLFVRISGDDRPVNKTVADVKQSLNTVDKTKVEPKITLPTAKVNEDIEAMAKRLQMLSRQKIQLNVNSQLAKSEVSTLGRQLDELRKKRTTVSVDLQSDVDRQIAEVEKELTAASRRQTKIPLTVERVDDKIAAIRAQVEELGKQDTTVNVDVDADTAAAEAKLDAIDGRDVKVDVKVNSKGAGDSGAKAGAEFNNGFLARVRDLAVAQLAVSQLSKGFPDLTFGIQGAASAMTALTGAGATLGAALIPIAAFSAAGILSLGPALLAGASGAGVAALAFKGVGDALTALGAARASAGADAAAQAVKESSAAAGVKNAIQGVRDARAAAASGAQQAARAVSDAARGVSDAERAAAEASRQAAQQVRDARRGVADATQQASDDIRQALEDQVKAEENLAAAQADAKQAQQDLNDARVQARRDLEDMNFDVREGVLREQEAVLSLADAKATLDKVNRDPRSTAADRKKALLDYQEQQLALEELRLRNKRLAADSSAANKAGVDGSKKVKTAEEQLAAAQKRVADAQKEAAKAALNVSKTRVAAARSIRKAEEAVTDALRNQQRVASSNARSISDAERRLSDARAAQAAQAGKGAEGIAAAQDRLKSAQDAYREAVNGSSAAQQNLNAALAGAGSGGAKFAIFLDSLRGELGTLQDAAQGGFLTGLTGGIKALLPLMPSLVNLITRISGQLGSMAQAAGDFVAGPEGRAFISFLSDTAPPLLAQLGRIFGNLVSGFLAMQPALMPVTDIIMGGLEQLSKTFDRFGSGTGIQKFVDYVLSIEPLVTGLFANVGKLSGDLIKALAPLSGPAIGFINDLVSALDSLFASNDFAAFIGSVGSILHALTPLMKTLSQVVGQVMRALSGELLAVMPVLIPALQLFAHTFGDVLNGLSPLLGPLIELASTLLSVVLPAIYPVITIFRVAMIPVVKAVSAALLAAMPAIRAIIGSFSSLMPVVAGVLGALAPLIPVILTALAPAFDLLIRVVKAILPVLAPIITTLVNLLVPGIKVLVRVLDILMPIFEAWEGLIADLYKPLERLGQIVDDVFSGKLGDAKKNFLLMSDEIRAAVDKWLPVIWGAVKKAGMLLWQWIKPQIPIALHLLGVMIKTLARWFGAVGGPWLWKAVVKLGEALLGWILPRIPALIADLVKFVGKIISWMLTKGVPMIAKGLASLGGAFIKAVGGAVAGAVGGVVGPALSGIKGLFGKNQTAVEAGQAQHYTNLQKQATTGMGNIASKAITPGWAGIGQAFTTQEGGIETGYAQHWKNLRGEAAGELPKINSRTLVPGFKTEKSTFSTNETAIETGYANHWGRMKATAAKEMPKINRDTLAPGYGKQRSTQSSNQNTMKDSWKNFWDKQEKTANSAMNDINASVKSKGDSLVAKVRSFVKRAGNEMDKIKGRFKDPVDYVMKRAFDKVRSAYNAVAKTVSMKSIPSFSGGGEAPKPIDPKNLRDGGLARLAVGGAVRLSRFARGGGLLRGPGGPRDDKILGLDRRTKLPTSWVSNKEFVVNERSTSANRKLVEAINAAHGPLKMSTPALFAGGFLKQLPGHADGALVGAAAPPKPTDDELVRPSRTQRASLGSSAAGVKIPGMPDLAKIAGRGPQEEGGYGASGGGAVSRGKSMIGEYGWYRRCLAFVNAAWNHSVGRFRLGTARQSMNAGPRTMKGTPPGGAGVYWDTGPSGHIALAVGDGTVISNDIVKAGRLDRVKQQRLNKWGPYRGWWHPGGAKGGAGGNFSGGGGADFTTVIHPRAEFDSKVGSIGKLLGHGLYPWAKMLGQLAVQTRAGSRSALPADFEVAGSSSGGGAMPSGTEMGNARTIAKVGAGMGKRAQTIGIATAIVESGLRNVHYGDRDSLGLFQQRGPWGPASARLNPATSAGMFFHGGRGGQRGLDDIRGWRGMPMGTAAQRVQVSAFPGRYSAQIGRAQGILSRLGDGGEVGGLASGGVVRGGNGGITAHVGEGRFDELVTPLPRGWDLKSSGSGATDDAIRALIAEIRERGLDGPHIDITTYANDADSAAQLNNSALQRAAYLGLV